MTKYLRCFKSGQDITVGNRYEVIGEDDGDFVFIDDVGDEHSWPIEPDEDGDSYRDHFTLETDKDDASITVLPDESLGCIEREYREVKRKANAGERVKIVDITYAGDPESPAYAVGETFIVNGFDGCDPTIDRKFNDGSAVFLDKEEYVVLEPTDTIHLPIKGRISGTERLRMVDRKAAVGERVIIVNNELPSNYEVGEVFNVQRYGEETESLYGGIYIDELRGRRDQNVEGFVRDGKYRVLEPLNTVPLLSEQSAQDQAAATISALALRLDALTERMDALEAKVDAAYTTQPTTTVDTEVVLKAVRKFSEGLKRSVSDALKTPQQRRDEVVERAKADVKRLENKHQSMMEFEGAASFWPRGCEKYGKTPCHFVEYVVDRDKRTVVALIRFIESRRVDYRGVAKCAPNDVFNAHIGKAIALHRALGLDVPAEYLNVPKPTEVRKGDAVRSTSGIYTGVDGYVDKITDEDSSPSGVFFKHSRANRRDGRIYKSIRFIEIIDDTREEVPA